MKNIKKQFKFRKNLNLLTLALAFSGALHAQMSYTFTSCGQTGPIGPNQSQANTAYGLTNLNGSVTANNGIQSFTVPQSGLYRIIAIGAQGGYNGGPGAYMAGNFALTAGTVLNVLVGQTGTTYTAGNGSFSSGGGGGSFVSGASPGFSPYVVAGGGGGDATGIASNFSAFQVCTGYVAGMEGSITTTANAEPNTSTPGGTNGNGGTCGASQNGGSGAGFYGDGLACWAASAALSFTNGGAGGSANPTGNGGFGGGGGSWGTGLTQLAGGGGGYSGGSGGATYFGPACQAPGGGGGSFNGGTNQTNSVTALGLADGKVIITMICSSPSITIQTSSASICAGSSLTLTANGGDTYTWSALPSLSGATNPTLSTIVQSPSVTTQYTLNATDAAGCSGTQSVTITVNPIPTPSIQTSSAAVCAGASLTLTATGGNTYTWSALPSLSGVSNPTSATIVASPTITTQYIVNSTSAAGCSNTQSVNTVVNPLPTLSVSLEKPTICIFESGVLTTNGSCTSWLWNTAATTPSIIVTPTTTTNYTVTGTGANGCSRTVTVTQNVANCVGIEQINDNIDDQLFIYPNPSSGDLTIHLQTPMNIRIVNELGQLVQYASPAPTNQKLQIVNLTSGIYFIIAEKDGHITTRKVVVTK